MNFSNKTLRNTLRNMHLAIAGLVGAYFYTPLGDVEWFASLVRVSVMPVFVITGLSMWQMPLITKLLKRQSLPAQQDA